MTKDLIRKYIWLVDTVNMAGSRGISYQDISDKWEQNTELSGGNKYSWRTFMNNRKDVFEISVLKLLVTMEIIHIISQTATN